MTSIERFKAMMEILPPEMKKNVKKIKITWKQCGEYSGQLLFPEIEITYIEEFA